MARLVLEVEHDLVGYRLMNLVGVDVRAEHVAGERLIRAQEGCAREPDEDGAFEPALHLLVQCAALRPVAFIHEYVEGAVTRRRRSLQVERIELVHQRTHHPRRGVGEVAHELCAGGNPHVFLGLAHDARVLHDAGDLLVQLIAICHDEDARGWVMLQEPLGQQHHQDALATPLRMPDHAAFTLRDALLSGLHAAILMLARHLLPARVKNHEVPNEIQQARLVAQLGEWAVQQRTDGSDCRGHLVLPLDEELLGRSDGPVLQSLRVAPRQQKLRGREEPLVEDRLLIGDELPDAVGHLHRAVL